MDSPYILDVRESVDDYLSVIPGSKIIWGVPYDGRTTTSNALNATTVAIRLVEGLRPYSGLATGSDLRAALGRWGRFPGSRTTTAPRRAGSRATTKTPPPLRRSTTWSTRGTLPGPACGPAADGPGGQRPVGPHREQVRQRHDRPDRWDLRPPGAVRDGWVQRGLEGHRRRLRGEVLLGAGARSARRSWAVAHRYDRHPHAPAGCPAFLRLPGSRRSTTRAMPSRGSRR